ncbi:hypothetical protein Bca52824_030540 [Brassica carinata]|uniref:Nuclear cap-binding protein subunit 2 n=1 Tax=Brassica carinata TaxID=52824 RepID=A0A8X7V4F9_BRACI|nr:hypothetical protein Bca52824_030540 [Brassica carinata]
MGAWSKRWPDEYRTDYDPDILSFLFDGRRGGGYGQGVSTRHGRGGRDFHRKRQRKMIAMDVRTQKRNSDCETRRDSDHDMRPEKDPRFSESSDSVDGEDDRKRRS